MFVAFGYPGPRIDDDGYDMVYDILPVLYDYIHHNYVPFYVRLCHWERCLYT